MTLSPGRSQASDGPGSKLADLLFLAVNLRMLSGLSVGGGRSERKQVPN